MTLGVLNFLSGRVMLRGLLNLIFLVVVPPPSSRFFIISGRFLDLLHTEPVSDNLETTFFIVLEDGLMVLLYVALQER